MYTSVSHVVSAASGNQKLGIQPKINFFPVFFLN